MLPLCILKGKLVFFSRHDSTKGQFFFQQPTAEAKKISAHGIYFTEIAATLVVFAAIIENTIPVKNKSFDTGQSRLEICIRDAECAASLRKNSFGIHEMKIKKKPGIILAFIE